MPMYDFQCDAGHKFEAFKHVRKLNAPQRCSCGAKARRVDFLRAPSLAFAVATAERETYAQHNVTFTGVSAKGDSSIGFTPNSHDDQCHCEVCVRHRRRSLVTEAADAGKDVQICLR
jgi:putative FmdB family regulatory protein